MNLQIRRKAYDQAGSFAELLSTRCALDANTLLTKGGDLLRVFKVQGQDYEGLDAAAMEASCQSMRAALKPLGDGITLYQVHIRRNGASVPAEVHPENPIVKRATENRHAFFQSKAQTLYTVDVYFVLCAHGQWGGERDGSGRDLSKMLRHYFSSSALVEDLNHTLDAALEKFDQKAKTFAALSGASLEIELLDKGGAFRLFRRLLNFKAEKDVGLKYDEAIDHQACGSTLECFRDHLRLDDQFVQVLTLKETPKRTFANLLSELYALPGNCIVVTEWRAPTAARLARIIRGKRRHFHNSKASLINFLSTAPAGAQDVLVDDSALGYTQELGKCLDEMELGANIFAEFSLTIVVHDEDMKRLRQAVGACLKIFSAHDAQLIEERYNALNAYLAAIPGNHQYNLRRLWLAATNYADLSFLFSVHGGERFNSHLKAEYLAAFETVHGTPFFFNLHVKDVAHTLVLGNTGSGKSFLLCFLLTHVQKYQPRTFIFDLGGSYKTLTRLFGGSYLKVANAALASSECEDTADGGLNRLFTINPFALPLTDTHRHFLFAFVRALIEGAHYVMTAAEEKDLFEQIDNLYDVEPSQRRLSTLSTMLGRTLRDQLQKWVQGGPYAAVFDNATDTLTLANFQTFDFEGMEKTPQVLEALLFYIFHRAGSAIYDETLDTTFKVFVMDEAWRFLKHPAIRSYAAEALKTWRKKNAAMILATQSTDDLLKSEMLDTVAENCPTKIFLANPGMNRELYRQVFQLSETEADLIAGLQPKRQLLVKRPGFAKVLNLEVDPESYWIFTSDPYDNEKRRAAFEHGFEKGLELLTKE